MYKIIITSLLLGFMLYSCGGGTDQPVVIYPVKGVAGNNLLSESTVIIDSTQKYGLIAQVATGNRCKVILTNLSDSLPKGKFDKNDGSFWKVHNLENDGWYVEDYNLTNHTQTFICEGPSKGNVTLDLFGCGRVNIQVFETLYTDATVNREIEWKFKCPN